MAKSDPTAASHAVLVEVMNVLGAFRDQIVLVGGWVPELLFPNRGHIGSLDVDLAIPLSAATGVAYTTIRKRLADAGYSLTSPTTKFIKHVDIGGTDFEVKVDLITGQYQQGSKSPGIQIDELVINSLRGLDLAFDVCGEIEISGTMPDGTQNTVRARIVQPEAFILIKAFALNERVKEKDAYDIAFVLECFDPSLKEFAARLRPLLASGLAQEGFQILRTKFETIDSVGPVGAARVYEEQGKDYEQARRAAFENAQALIRAVDGLE